MPSPRRPGSPSMWYSGVGCTTERADHPTVLGTAAMTCVGSEESGQKRQTVSGWGAPSPESSPVITQERVMGSLRSSIYQLNIAGEAASSNVSKFQRFKVSSKLLRNLATLKL